MNNSGKKRVLTFLIIGGLLKACDHGDSTAGEGLENPNDPPAPGETEPVLIPQKIVVSPVDPRDGQLVLLAQPGFLEEPDLPRHRATRNEDLSPTYALRVRSSREEQLVPIGREGEFSLVLEAGEGDGLELLLEEAEGAIGRPLGVEVPSRAALPLADRLEIVQLSDGRHAVSGRGVVAPGAAVHVANDDLGMVVSGASDADGTFLLALESRTDDLILVVAANAEGAAFPVRGLVSEICNGRFCTASQICQEGDPGTLCEEASQGHGPPWCRDDADRLPKNNGGESSAPRSCPEPKCKYEKLCGKF